MTLEEFTAYPDTPQKDVINIPVYEQAFSAGRGQELPDTAEVIDYVALPANLKKYRENMCASYVRGDSMEPTLFDNDIILYDNFGYDGTDGIYAINYRGCAFGITTRNFWRVVNPIAKQIGDRIMEVYKTWKK